MKGSELLRDWYVRVWQEGDLTAIQDYFDEEALAGGFLGDMNAELGDLMAIVPAIQRILRNVKVHIDDSMDDGDKSWALIRLTADVAATMTPVTISAQVMIRHKNDRILSAVNHIDILGFFEAAGFVPGDLREQVLLGEDIMTA